MKKFSDRLLEARKKAGFTSQEDFAQVLEIPQQTYGNYESGRSFPKEEVLRKIGVTLNVSIDSLLGIEDFDLTPKQGETLNNKINTLKRNATDASVCLERLLTSIKKLEGAL